MQVCNDFDKRNQRTCYMSKNMQIVLKKSLKSIRFLRFMHIFGIQKTTITHL